MSSEYSPWNWFRSGFTRAVGFTILILWSITAVYPFLWTALTSLKSNQELYANIWGLPANPQWQNYIYAWTTGGTGGTNSVETGFINSIIVTALSIIILFVISPMAAYALGRAEYRGKSTTLYLLIAGMYIAPQISLVPLFVLFAGLGLTNSLLGLVIIYVSSGLPYAVFISRLGFLSIPSSLEEAARVDGLSTFQTYWRVTLPLAMPTVLIAMILEAIFVWNDFLYPLVFINSPNLNTLQLTLYNNFWNGFNPQYGALSAGIVISTIPLLMLYLIFSDRIKKGVAAGIGVKT